MNKIVQYKTRGSYCYILIILFFFISGYSFSQNLTTVKGIVLDSATREPLPYVTVQFKKTSTGVFTDDDGKFKLSRKDNTISTIVVTYMGYETQEVKIQLGRVNDKTILLKSSDHVLKEIVIRPQKEKYSKKNNPAVDLIEKVIANKKKNSIASQEYYQFKEYERVFFAINDFNANLPQFKRYKFLSNYTDSSLIDNKLILPFSIREKISDVYYRKNPKTNRRIVKGFHVEGVDQVLETEGLEAIISETFKDVLLTDNSITLLYNDFVSPLSEHSAVSFYKWYITDTVTIDSERYINLSFAPFNSRDIGFTGNLFISTDGTYGVKRAVLKTPKKMNVNYVEDLVLYQEFKQTNAKVWIPQEYRMAIDLSLLNALKFYVDKTQTFESMETGIPADSIYKLGDPVIFEQNFAKHDKEFWAENRPQSQQKDYKMDKMMEELQSTFLFKVIKKTGNILLTGRIPLKKDSEINKLEFGTLPTFYSYNKVEGNRLRLTLNTTKNFNSHLFLYGYGAYGTHDQTFKYYTEATWAFKEVQKDKDQFPQNNLSVAIKYDLNSLGQRFTQAERDNILMSIRASGNQKLTYSHQVQLMYKREFHEGLGITLSTQTFDERPAGSLLFEKMDADGLLYPVNRISTSELTVSLRYAPNEKFFQQRRKRFTIPSQQLVMTLSNTKSFEHIFGSQFNYNKSSFSVGKEKWIAPFGKVMVNVSADKIWGEAPFPMLLSPSANSSFTIQRGNFYLIEPLEFVHDEQVTFDVNYRMGGWFFNRIPLLNRLKWREVAGFRAFYGTLSDRNNPKINRDQLIFPQNSYSTSGRKPYMEYNVGIENIFNIFRVDYVRRLNYLDHPNISKDGIRLSFEFSF